MAMFGFFRNSGLSDQILVDVVDYLHARPQEREVFREATALSLGITMRMISRWPQQREPLILVLTDIRYRLHPDGSRLLSQQFTNSAKKARGTGRKSLMYGYGIMACWLIAAAQSWENQSGDASEELERYDRFFSKLFSGHAHLLSDDSLAELHEKFYIRKPGTPHPKDRLKHRPDSFSV
jgi:hypothetical protein